MAYAPLDEHFDEHPKFEDLDLEHFGLMACAITYCNRNLTDGRVSFAAVRRFGKKMQGPKAAKRLVELGIWRDTDGGWEIDGYLDHNPSKAEVLAKREEGRRRKEAYRRGRPRDPGDGGAPPDVPHGVPSGQTSGRSAGRTRGQHTGQTLSVPEPRARAPAGALHFTALHCTALDSNGSPQGPPGGWGSIVFDVGGAACAEAEAAYAEVVGEARGGPVAIRIRLSEREDLIAAVNAHFVPGARDKLHAVERLRNAVRTWVREVLERGEERYTKGWSPSKFREWIDTYRVPKAAPAPRTAAAPEAADEEPATEEELAALREIFATDLKARNPVAEAIAKVSGE